MSTIDYFIGPAKVLNGRMEQLTAGITPAMAARKPHFERAGKPVTVDCNHATFLYGHLAIYLAKMLERCGLDTAGIAVSPEWEALFKAGAPCLDDPDGTIYPAFEAVKTHYFHATTTALNNLAGVPDSTLQQPPAEERLRARFPTIGSMINFLLLGHTSMHLGQLSTWRRCMGLASVE